MNATEKQRYWADFLKFYGEQNKGRSTRLGVFEEESDVVTDYWIEDGLPLDAITVETRADFPTVEILLGNYTHTIKQAKNLKIYFALKASEEGLDITDATGKTVILRFENDRVG